MEGKAHQEEQAQGTERFQSRSKFTHCSNHDKDVFELADTTLQRLVDEIDSG